MRTLVTGGAGFIGIHLVRLLLERGHAVLNLDNLTYAANLDALKSLGHHPLHDFIAADVADGQAVRNAVRQFKPDAIIHLAAESHVDRSIEGPAEFIRTNILGTYALLDAALDYWNMLPPLADEGVPSRDAFRFIQVSTDEVYGQLGETGHFTIDSPYKPRSPYSASKASADHLVGAWHATHGLPTIVSHGSNTFGPGQHEEKLIPRVIRCALAGEPIPVYGDGSNIRDWIHVSDHAEALLAVLEKGRIGASYHICGCHELRNIDLVRRICGVLDELRPRVDGTPHADRISFVADRPGHDFRYALDPLPIQVDTGWQPRRDFAASLIETVRSYLPRQ